MKFNFTSQVCTSLSQSERLLALGLKADTADMRHILFDGDLEPCIRAMPWNSICKPCQNNFPSWSLHRLIELAEVSVEVSGIWVRISSTYRYEEKDNVFDNLIDAIADLINNDVFNKEYLE